jgi:hypothetical protein
MPWAECQNYNAEGKTLGLHYTTFSRSSDEEKGLVGEIPLKIGENRR